MWQGRAERDEVFHSYLALSDTLVYAKEANLDALSFVFYELPKASRTATARWIVHANACPSSFIDVLCKKNALMIEMKWTYSPRYHAYRMWNSLINVTRPPENKYRKIRRFAVIQHSPLMEKVVSCRFLCPSSLGPFVDGVTTADSGRVGTQLLVGSFIFGLWIVPFWLRAAAAAAAALACSLAFAIAASSSANLFASASVRATPRGL